MRLSGSIGLALALLAVAGWEGNVEDGNDAPTVEPTHPAAPPQLSPAEQARQAELQQMRMQARREVQDLRFLVDISDRQLRISKGDEVVATHDVAVGTSDWPTPTGEWKIHRVDINPEWVPPKEEEWAEDEETKAPGDPENPMGKARLVYRMPNTIHGTDDLASLGKASSHGSIRVANEVVVQLAQMLLKAGGAWDGPQWFQHMLETETEEYQVKLQQPVPITVQE